MKKGKMMPVRRPIAGGFDNNSRKCFL